MRGSVQFDAARATGSHRADAPGQWTNRSTHPVQAAQLISTALHRGQHPRPRADLGPPVEPFEDRVPRPEPLGHITPRSPRAVAPHDALHHQPMIKPRPATTGHPRQQRRHHHPHLIGNLTTSRHQPRLPHHTPKLFDQHALAATGGAAAAALGPARRVPVPAVLEAAVRVGRPGDDVANARADLVVAAGAAVGLARPVPRHAAYHPLAVGPLLVPRPAQPAGRWQGFLATAAVLSWHGESTSQRVSVRRSRGSRGRSCGRAGRR